MNVILSKRHKVTCPNRGDKTYRRCRCSIWLEWNTGIWLEWNTGGKQSRKSEHTFTWETAQAKARRIEQGQEDNELGRAPAAAPAEKRVDAAIALFMKSKQGEELAEAHCTGTS